MIAECDRRRAERDAARRRLTAAEHDRDGQPGDPEARRRWEWAVGEFAERAEECRWWETEVVQWLSEWLGAMPPGRLNRLMVACSRHPGLMEGLVPLLRL